MKSILLFVLVLPQFLFAQQDCVTAIPLCQTLSFANSYTGTGNGSNEVNSATSCLGGGEVNSVWFHTMITSSGNLAFDIVPNNSTDDYDWAVYDLTNASCLDIYNNAALEIGCNFSGLGGTTGPNGGGGAQNEPPIPVLSGMNIAILVTNWSGTPNGFTIDPSASTAFIGCDSACVDTSFYLTANVVNGIDCSTSCNGSASVSINGGTPPYTIFWSDSAATTTSNVSNLCIGNYTVTVTDSTGCARGTSVSMVPASSSPIFNQTSTLPTSCSSCDGSIDMQLNQGFPPFTYQWSPAPPTGQGTPNISSLCQGIHTLTITDSFGCDYTYEIALFNSMNPAPQIDNILNPTCFGGCDGVLEVSAASGTNPINYLWNTGDTTANIYGLCAGTYALTMTDANGCVDSSTSITLVDPPLFLLDSMNGVWNYCGNNCTGSLGIFVSGGIPPYTYILDSAISSPNNTFNNLCAGNYTVTIMDSVGCVLNQTFQITNTLISITVSADTAICANACVQLNVSGNATYYQWFPSVGLNNPTITNPIACPPTSITYCVAGFDSAGCSSDTLCIYILVYDSTAFGTSGDVTIMEGDSTLICGFPVIGNYTYAWSTGENSPCITVSPTDTTVYYITMNDSCGNSYNDSITVNVTPPNGMTDLPTVLSQAKVFPNPGKGDMTLAFEMMQAGNAHISLLDITGRTVSKIHSGKLRAGAHSMSLAPFTRPLPDGLYWVKMDIGEQQQSLKILVIR